MVQLKGTKVLIPAGGKLPLRSASLQAGQGLVEYILVLLVTISLLMALKAFYKPFNVFLTNYMGGYLSCLMETGELPGTQGGLCEQNYKPYAATQNFGLGGGAGAGQNSNLGSQGSGSNGQSGGPANQTPASMEQSGSGGGGGGAGGAGANSPFSQFLAGGGSNNSTNGVGAGAGKKKGSKTYTGSSAISSQASDSGSSSSSPPFSQTLGQGFMVVGGQKKKHRAPASVVTKPSQIRSAKQAAFAQKAQTKKKQVALHNSGFSLGTMLRFLLIAAIMIAIFILIGSQVLNLQKSWEK